MSLTQEAAVAALIAKSPGLEADFHRLGDLGLVVSVCYGPMGGSREHLYSVDILNPETGESFEKPYAARSFAQALAIAEVEGRAQGLIL